MVLYLIKLSVAKYQTALIRVEPSLFLNFSGRSSLRDEIIAIWFTFTRLCQRSYGYPAYDGQEMPWVAEHQGDKVTPQDATSRDFLIYPECNEEMYVRGPYLRQDGSFVADTFLIIRRRRTLRLSRPVASVSVNQTSTSE